jgi:hypothetical protein
MHPNPQAVVTKKSDLAAKHLAKIALRHPVPEPLPEGSLLDQALYSVLLRRLPAERAQAALKNMHAAYEDWNEARVAQSQELAQVLKVGKRGVDSARDVRELLQEVFQHSHGLELEFMREDPVAAARLVANMTFFGLAQGNYLLWLAGGKQLPVTGDLVRVLDRLGLMNRTASIKKASAAVLPLVEEGKELDFAMRFGEVATRWCHKKPLCHLCVLVDECRFGKKAFKEWKVQQARLEAQRKKDEARREVQRKKDEARRLREDERERKRSEATAKRRTRELERQRRITERARQAEEKRRAREAQIKQRAEEKKKEAARKAAAKLAAQKKAAEAKRKAEAKKKALAAKKKAQKKKKTGPGTASKRASARKGHG